MNSIMKFLTAAVALCAVTPVAATPLHTYSKIFDGTDTPINQHSFRVPCLVKAKNNYLVAIVECRKDGTSDFGDININFKRSANYGNTWDTTMGEVVGTGPGSWTNPTAVVDMNSSTGRIWCFMSWNSDTIHAQSEVDVWGERKVYSMYSDTNGASWVGLTDRTAALLPPSYHWDAMGPGIGIQMAQPATQPYGHPGWLVIPAVGRNIYSENGGGLWKLQPFASGGKGESTVTELTNGKILRNDRPTGTYESGQPERRHLASGPIDGAMSSFTPHETLLDPHCEGSSLRYNFASGTAPERIIFLNSASSLVRTKMRLRVSYDGGVTWPAGAGRRLYDGILTEQQEEDQGKGGYSSMIKWGDVNAGYGVGALVEINEGGTAQHRSIEYHKMNLEWILNGYQE